MIKYLGSKRRLLPLLTPVLLAGGPGRALDLFSGTARVGQAMKAAGCEVTAVDSASYAFVLAETYIGTDADKIDIKELADALSFLQSLPGRPGYVTEVFARTARYFHPANAERIDAIRQEIDDSFGESPLRPLLLASLLEAADRVDSTTGVQMAYLKQLAPRALRPLELRAPRLLPGTGRALCEDALAAAGRLGPFEVAYLDPPYNQHQYRGNYHVWETIVRWDSPEHYGVACKRSDCRDELGASPFNRRRQMPAALESVVATVDAELVVVSHNDESWLRASDLVAMCERRLSVAGKGGEVGVLAVDHPRYVGSRIGIHNPRGEKVGSVSHVRNNELLVLAGPRPLVRNGVLAGLAGARAAGLVAEAVPLEALGAVGRPA
jgi:adenine-specific DNA-methyltransferase